MHRFKITEETPLYKVKEQLDLAIVGHEEAKIGLLFALLTGEHMYIEGLQGSAKTLLAEVGARSINLVYFFYQVHRDMRFSELTEGDLLVEKRVTDPGAEELTKESIIHRKSEPNKGGLLQAEIALLDDITRTPGEALNVLLRIANERKYQDTKLPLINIIATSNPTILSETEETFNPIYYNEPLDPANLDRFLVQIKLEPFLEQKKFNKGREILKKSAAKYWDHFVPARVMSRMELDILQEQLHTIHIPDEVLDLYIIVIEKLFNIAEQKEKRNIIRSDRTFFKKIVKILRASAMLAGRNTCNREDIYALRFITAFRLPEIHNDIEKLIEAIMNAALKNKSNPDKDERKEMLYDQSASASDPFQTPKKDDTESPKNDSAKDKINETILEPQSVEAKENSEMEIEAEQFQDMFIAYNPDATEAGRESNIVLKGAEVKEYIDGIKIVFKDIISGSQRNGSNSMFVRTGGVPRNWQSLRDWSDIDQVNPIDLTFEDTKNLRIAKRTEKKEDVIALLRDISTSMSESNAEAASRIGNSVLEFAKYNHIPLFYMTLHSEPNIFRDHGSVITQNYERLAEAFAKTDVASATNYQNALREFLLVTSRFQYIKNFHLIIVGDGKVTSGDPYAVEEIRALQKRRIRAYTINTETEKSFYSDEYPALFKKLVKDTQGRGYQVAKNARWCIKKMKI